MRVPIPLGGSQSYAVGEEFEFSKLLGLKWWARMGSNQRPTGYEPVALPLSYGPQTSSLYMAVLPCQGRVVMRQGTTVSQTVLSKLVPD